MTCLPRSSFGHALAPACVLALAFACSGTSCGGGASGTTPGGTGGSGASSGGASGSGGSSAPGAGGTSSPGGGGAPGAGTGGAPGPIGAGGSGGAAAPDSDAAPGAGGSAGDAAPTGDSAPNPPSGELATTCNAMIEAAKAFITSVDGDAAKRGQAVKPFDAPDRIHFKYTPGTRPGLSLQAMTPAQRDAALALLKASLSSDGLAKAEQVRGLEVVLDTLGDGANRNPLLYYVAIYGTPAADGDWSWRWEGHHLSLHFLLSKCTAAVTVPTFFGANPARVPQLPGNPAGAPPMGTRPLGKEEDLARGLATMLNADAQKRAMAIATAGGGGGVPDVPATQMPRTPAGLAASAMNPAELEELKKVITEWAATMAPALAAARLKKVQDAGYDKVTFFWRGSVAPNQNYYYRVQGPTFLIESSTDMGPNHIHSAWRDFNGDFGVDVIKLHLDNVPH